MTETSIATLECEARQLADEVCQAICDMDLPEIKLHSVGSDVANGSNSLDVDFWNRLQQRDHLTPDFLAGLKAD